MRHAYFGKKLSRTKNERRRLFQNLVRNLFVSGRLRTTIAKAKAVQPLVERLIVKAKRGGRPDVNLVRRTLINKILLTKLMADAKTRFAARSSGFTRIVKLGRRAGDGSEEVILGFVDEPVVSTVKASSAKAVSQEKKQVKTQKHSNTQKRTRKETKG